MQDNFERKRELSSNSIDILNTSIDTDYVNSKLDMFNQYKIIKKLKNDLESDEVISTNLNIMNNRNIITMSETDINNDKNRILYKKFIETLPKLQTSKYFLFDNDKKKENIIKNNASDIDISQIDITNISELSDISDIDTIDDIDKTELHIISQNDQNDQSK
jgi:hypothetical protein